MYVLQRLDDVVRRLYVCLYGIQRKTFTAVHLPTSGPSWEGKILYIAADVTSPKLESVFPADRARMEERIIIPDGNVREVQGKLVTDWTQEWNDICHTHWKKKFPDICAIIFDTITASARVVLQETKKMSTFPSASTSKLPPRDPNNVLPLRADPQFQLHKEDFAAQGDRGDYGLQGQTILEGIRSLLSRNSDVHVICLFHQCISEGARDGTVGKKIGPSIEGRQGPIKVKHYFGSTLHVSAEDGKLGTEGDTRILLREHDSHIAEVKGVRTEIPAYKHIGFDPEQVREFWKWLQNIKVPKE